MKSRLFLDTNVILDLLGSRQPYYEAIAKIATLAERGDIEIVASALSYATVNYFLSKYESAAISADKLRKFKTISLVCPLDDQIISQGLSSSFSDFEGALQYFGALRSNCHMLITRNGKDFKTADMPVMTADEYLRSLNK